MASITRQEHYKKITDQYYSEIAKESKNKEIKEGQKHLFKY